MINNTQIDSGLHSNRDRSTESPTNGVEGTTLLTVGESIIINIFNILRMKNIWRGQPLHFLEDLLEGMPLFISSVR